MGAGFGHRTATADAIAAFGSLTGDYSRIHFDHEFARATGFDAPIAHGLLSASWALGALTRHEPEKLGLGDPTLSLAHFDVRFASAVVAGDTLGFGLREAADEMREEEVVPAPGQHPRVHFEASNQRGKTCTTGSLVVGTGDAPAGPSPPASTAESWDPASGPAVYHAEDLVACGPRGESAGRTLTEADLVAWTGHTGELNPLYLDREFARVTRSGGRLVPPLLVFCLAFSSFLRELLRAPMPAAESAGHLGDSFRCFAPVNLGDTLRVRHRPLSQTGSRSRPELAIVHFELHVLNQSGVLVQEGRVAMMVGRREGG